MNLGTPDKPMNVSAENVSAVVADVQKVLDAQRVPTKGRMLYDPETGEFIKVEKEDAR